MDLKLKLETVQDAIDLQGMMIAIASNLEEMKETIPNLNQCGKTTLSTAVKILDFFADEMIPKLSVNH